VKTIVVGAGPAGLIAADILSAAGVDVAVYERMPSPGRKFLMAGRGGLNITHTEDFAAFLARYLEAAAWLRPHLEAFAPSALRAWADELGAETFVGTSGRVFPKAMKASPLLRALLQRLERQGVRFFFRHEWRGWNEVGELAFFADGKSVAISADATLLALGGASWPKLGSTGAWADILRAKGVAVAPFKPANCGFVCAWSERFKAFAGEPLKSLALSFGGQTVRGEAVIVGTGLEGGGVYALSRPLRDEIERAGFAVLGLDLRPEMAEADIAAKLKAVKKGASLSNALRKALHLPPVAINLMREAHGLHLPNDPDRLAACVKAVPLRLIAPAPIERAISSAGGIRLAELDGNLQLRKLPGVFAAGEMLDWEAPTGGYLLTACFATGAAAATRVLQSLARST
jgi:uncharacterized flavoprotein (TIGR03862 family)